MHYFRMNVFFEYIHIILLSVRLQPEVELDVPSRADLEYMKRLKCDLSFFVN